jgi:voltage-gated potassium channel Kch
MAPKDFSQGFRSAAPGTGRVGLGVSTVAGATKLAVRGRNVSFGRTWQRHRLVILATLASGALVFGFVGSLLNHRSVPDSIYDTLAMLTFNYTEPEGGASWMSQLARVMAPAVTAYATLAVITAVLAEQWQRQRASLCRGHVVVCGLGARGLQLVRSLRSGQQPARVVAIEALAGHPNVAAARALGAVVVAGDASQPEVLRLAAVHRAAALISVCSSDTTNAAVAGAARDLKARGGRPLEVYCHAASPSLAQELTARGLSDVSERFSLQWFSIPERAARLLVAQYAGLAEAAMRDEIAHVVVIGFDALARAIVVNSARQWRAVGAGRPLRMTVAGQDADELVAHLEREHPLLRNLLDCRTDSRSLSTVAGTLPDDATVAFVCAPSDTLGLELGFALAWNTPRHLPVVVRLTETPEAVLDVLSLDADAPISVFNEVERACSKEMVADDIIETIAQAIHATYIAESARTAEPDATRPVCSYEELSDELKASNRAHARDVACKLRALHCGVRPLTDWDAKPIDLEAEEIERLAEAEHARWNADRIATGWRWGAVTDRPHKINKWIDVPWADLPEAMKEYDRVMVRELPRTLAVAGYQLYRLDEPAPQARATRPAQPRDGTPASRALSRSRPST